MVERHRQQDHDTEPTYVDRSMSPHINGFRWNELHCAAYCVWLLFESAGRYTMLQLILGPRTLLNRGRIEPSWVGSRPSFN
jgi:hypothetical protein